MTPIHRAIGYGIAACLLAIPGALGLADHNWPRAALFCLWALATAVLCGWTLWHARRS